MKEGRLEVYFLLQWIHKLQIVSSTTFVSPSFSELIPLQAAIFIIIIMLLIQVNADGKNKTEQQQCYGQLEFLLHENFITKKDGQDGQDGVFYNIMRVQNKAPVLPDSHLEQDFNFIQKKRLVDVI